MNACNSSAAAEPWEDKKRIVMEKARRWDGNVAKKMEHMLLGAVERHCEGAPGEEKRSAWGEIRAFLAAFELAGHQGLADVATKALKSALGKSGGNEAAQAMLAEELIQCGARVDCRFEDGSTPLLRHAAAGSEKLCELLLAKGADAQARDANGCLPEQLAQEAGHAELARSLEAARLARNSELAEHGDALWVIDCSVMGENGQELNRAALSFLLAGDAAARLRARPMDAGQSVEMVAADALAPLRPNEVCRQAFKAWSGLAKAGSAWDATAHAGDPVEDGFGRLVSQKLSVKLFKGAALDPQKHFGELALKLANKVGASAWAFGECNQDAKRWMEAVGSMSIRMGRREGLSPALAARSLARMSKTRLDQKALADAVAPVDAVGEEAPTRPKML
jgi:hypothetical protein